MHESTSFTESTPTRIRFPLPYPSCNYNRADSAQASAEKEMFFRPTHRLPAGRLLPSEDADDRGRATRNQSRPDSSLEASAEKRQVAPTFLSHRGSVGELQLSPHHLAAVSCYESLHQKRRCAPFIARCSRRGQAPPVLGWRLAQGCQRSVGELVGGKLCRQIGGSGGREQEATLRHLLERRSRSRVRAPRTLPFCTRPHRI